MRALTAGSFRYSPVCAVDVERDRHAPGALARDDPVGPPLDHRRGCGSPRARGPSGCAAIASSAISRSVAPLEAATDVSLASMPDASRAATQPPAARRRVARAPVHRNEPLRRRALDHLGLGPPRMRIAVLEVVARREQRAGRAQVRTDRPVGADELLVDDASPARRATPSPPGTCRPRRPRTPGRSRIACTAGNRPRHDRAPCGRARCPRRS